MVFQLIHIISAQGNARSEAEGINAPVELTVFQDAFDPHDENGLERNGQSALKGSFPSHSGLKGKINLPEIVPVQNNGLSVCF